MGLTFEPDDYTIAEDKIHKTCGGKIKLTPLSHGTYWFCSKCGKSLGDNDVRQPTAKERMQICRVIKRKSSLDKQIKETKIRLDKLYKQRG